MFKNLTKANSPFYGFIIWFVIYAFFLNVLSSSFFTYVPPKPIIGTTSLSDLIMGVFVSDAQAATDSVRTTISASETVDAPAGGDQFYKASPPEGGGTVAVGGGSGAVNSVMGAYSYSYPIKVPPGRGGLSPELAISYSSMAGSGWLGLGWDLSIGSIQRSTKDGKPDYDDDDTFVITLKGSAITLVREDDEFRLKDEGLFLRILKQGDSWVATDKSGTQYLFGSTSNSRQAGPEGIFKWCLDIIRDANGNEILFSYDTDEENNQIYPQQISYDMDNYILFESEPTERNDAPSSYAAFFNVRTVRRLQDVKVFSGGLDAENLVRRYQLTYESAETTEQSMLKTITQYGSEGTALPPVILDYAASQSYENQPSFLSILGDYDVLVSDAFPVGENISTVDFTGDGRADFLVTPGPASSGSGWKLYETVDGGFSLAAEGTEFDDETKITPGDFNGDGKTDIIAYTNSDGSSQIYTSNGQGFDFYMTGPPPSEYEEIESQTPDKTFAILDLNGDGRSDLLRTYVFRNGIWGYSAANCYWELYLNTETGFQLIIDGGKVQDYDHQFEDVLPGDFNGDGKSDVLVLGGPKHPSIGGTTPTELYLSTGNNVVNASALDPAFLLPADLNHKSLCRTGDFNGDGKTDILAVAKSTGDFSGYRLYLSTGTALAKVKEDSWPDRKQPIFTGDYNGDGRTDMLVKAYESTVTKFFTPRLLLSTGRDFVEVGDELFPLWTERFHPGDYNGDGRTDMLLTADKRYSDWAGYKLRYARIDQTAVIPQTMARLLGSFTNMLGATTEITYEPSSIWPNNIDGGTYRGMPMVVPTVSEVTIHDNMGQGGASTNRFAYEGGFLDMSEREFRGFGKISVEDQATHINAVNYYHQQARFQGRVEKSVTYNSAGVEVLRTDNLWDAFVYHSAGGEENERTFAFVRQNTTIRNDDSGNNLTTITTDYEYDNYGNMTVEDKKEENHITGDITTRFVRSQYQYDTDKWILDKPEYIRTDTTDPGPSDPGNEAAAALRETRMTYDPDRPWLLESSSQVLWQEQDGTMEETEITTRYGYDAYGNTTWVGNPRNASWGAAIDYSESSGMFPNRTTNAAGHSIHRVFDPRSGAVLEESLNPESGTEQITDTQYDQFGRPELITFADLSTKAYAYHIEPGNHFIRVVSSQQPTVTTYYDNLDRVIKTEVDDGAQKVITDTIYDTHGRVWKTSLPRYAGETAQYSINEYDSKGRIVKQINPDETFRTIAYDGFDEIITDEKGYEKRITRDSLGRLQKVVEPGGGVTEYEYDPFGNLVWIEGPLDNQTHIHYDDLGRKISMDDPYMGHWEYRYDAAGNLVWQQDGQGRIVEMTYDAINRIETKNYLYTGRYIEYRYDEQRDGYFNTSKLTSLITTQPVQDENRITYDYDKMGRTAHETRQIDQVTYHIRRDYDLAGRVKNLYYPNNSLRIEYSYFAMGHLRSVEKIDTDATRTTLAAYSDYNALGQVGTVTYGNGAITQYGYNPDHHRLETLRTQAEKDGSYQFVQDLAYMFDNVGNVDAITDHANGVAYDFEYDNLHRLEIATADCATDPNRSYNQTYTYDEAGNMTAKTGKGRFEVTAWQDEQKHIRPASVIYAYPATGVGDRQIQYDQDNKPITITYKGDTSYLLYDGTGRRIKKSSSGGSDIYVGGIYEIRNGQVYLNIFANSTRLATVRSGQAFYTHGDHLGSSALVTDPDGQVVEEIGYLPFGATLFRNTYQNGTWTSPYRFTDREYDVEYELYNYNARLYDPVMGRFITADTVVPDWTDPQSLNRYSYCRNNPLRYVDPSGHAFTLAGLALAALYGALVGAVVGGITAAMYGGDVWEGIKGGAISGAISGAMFYCAGAYIKGDMFASIKVSSDVGKAAVHVVAGASSGAVNAAITGGDVGQAALIGGLSAGAAKYFGGANGLELGGRMVIGAAAGGTASVMNGGDFAQGAMQGAMASAIADICNRMAGTTIGRVLNRIKRYFDPIDKINEAYQKIRSMQNALEELEAAMDRIASITEDKDLILQEYYNKQDLCVDRYSYSDSLLSECKDYHTNEYYSNMKEYVWKPMTKIRTEYGHIPFVKDALGEI